MYNQRLCFFSNEIKYFLLQRQKIYSVLTSTLIPPKNKVFSIVPTYVTWKLFEINYSQMLLKLQSSINLGLCGTNKNKNYLANINNVWTDFCLGSIEEKNHVEFNFICMSGSLFRNDPYCIIYSWDRFNQNFTIVSDLFIRLTRVESKLETVWVYFWTILS
jgi:hypothetical protein